MISDEMAYQRVWMGKEEALDVLLRDMGMHP